MDSVHEQSANPKASLRRGAGFGSSASSSSTQPLSFSLVVIITVYVCLPLLPSSALSDPLASIITPNFTASNHAFIDNGGAFLASPDSSFQAKIINTKPDSSSFYLVVIHVSSSTILWSANRNNAIPGPPQLRLTKDGLTLYDDAGRLVWSTPSNISSAISALRLLNSGNLVLLDVANTTLWESFDYPTDVLLVGQKLPRGKSLVSSVSNEDLSEGSYRFVIGESDAMLEWEGMNYWMLSMDANAFQQANFPVEYYLVMNLSGVYVIGSNPERTVIYVPFPDSTNVSLSSSSFQIAKLESTGVFSIVSVDSTNGELREQLSRPTDRCRLPLICGRLGVCTNRGLCGCAVQFIPDSKTSNGGCVPNDTSLAMPVSCNGSSSGANIKYLSLTNELSYFANRLNDHHHVAQNVNLSACQNLCSSDCSCLAIFYSQGSRSCSMIRDYLGSTFISYSAWSDVGYIKTVMVEDPNVLKGRNKQGVQVWAVIVPLSLGVSAIALGSFFLWLRMKRRQWRKGVKDFEFGRGRSSAGMHNFAHIPGLPARFNYEEISAATQGFCTEIGSGGFGTVYKGTLFNGRDVAVKRIDCSGAEAKREFLTEIAAIGKIHHVNLVRLEGFCIHRGQRFLVYEYMNQGSLDRTLFRGEPVMEWKDRYGIALGTARGLEYLHTCCEHKIIHCDIKPENILLHNSLQVKVSDFGLSKLLTRDQSGFYTLLRGTRGYIAPEWLMNTAISEKTDVYSYGMVLLELISGKKNFFLQPDRDGAGNCPFPREDHDQWQVNFPLCALEMHSEGRYLELVDPRLMGEVPGEEVEKLVRVALCCVHRDPNLRPSMSDVVRMLEGWLALGEPKIESLNFLRFYDPGALVKNNNVQNEVVLRRQKLSSPNTPSNSSSYMSNQQVSGPR